MGIRVRRGTAAQNSNFTGPAGLIVMDIENKALRFHDGSTPGGFGVSRENHAHDASSIQSGVFSNARLPGNAHGNRTVSTGDPSGGVDGDIWYKF